VGHARVYRLPHWSGKTGGIEMSKHRTILVDAEGRRVISTLDDGRRVVEGNNTLALGVGPYRRVWIMHTSKGYTLADGRPKETK